MPTSINEPHTPAFEEVSGAVKPTITALAPASCAIGDADFDLHVTGDGFNEASIIYFAGHDEPTTLNEDGTVSTGVKPSLWGAPAIVKCYVRNGTLHSEPLDFEFTAGAGATGLGAKGAKGEPADFELTALEPDHIAISERRLFLTVIGEGFDKSCMVVFDDEEIPTAYVNKNTLTCSPPMASASGPVDVEVHRGEDMSDVLLFEFVSSPAARTIKEPTRKPKKAEPVHKRTKKSRR